MSPADNERRAEQATRAETPALVDLTSAQAALWFAHTLDPTNPTLNVCDVVEIEGPVDLELLVRAVSTALTESDALTTRFVETERGWKQLPGAFEIAECPVIEVDPTDPWGPINTVIDRWTGTPHDVSREPAVSQWIATTGERTFWILAAHHCLIDAFGLSLVFTRGAQLYRDLVAGTAPSGRPLGSIVPVAQADLDYLASATHTTDADYWSTAVRPRPASVDTTLPRAVRSSRVSLPMPSGNWGVSATAAVIAFLARRHPAPTTDITFLMMNRLGQASARVPTTAVNRVPLQIPTAPTDTIGDITTALSAAIKGASAHQRYRGEVIGVDPTLTTGFRGDLGITVNVKPFASILDFAGSPAVQHSIQRGPVTDFSVTLEQTPHGGVELLMDADPDRHGADALDRLRDELAGFIVTALAPDSAERPLAGLPLLSDHETERVLALGHGAANTEGEVTLLEMFDAALATTPEAIAVVDTDGAFSYAELAGWAARLAERLRRAGAHPGERVAIIAEASAQAVAGIIACWRVGCAYVPVDPSYPPDRVRYQLHDCGAEMALTTAATRPLADTHLPADITVLDLLVDPTDPLLDSAAAQRYPHPDSPAYLIYTSGSTGTPKGVVIPHRGVARLVGSHRRLTMPTRRLKVLSTHALSFDSIVGPLAWMFAGHSLYLIDRADVTDAIRVIDYVRGHHIDYVDAVPVLIEEYIRSGLLDPTGGQHIPGWLSVGGDAFPPKLWAELAERTDVTVFNLYGPTETTVDASFGVVGDTETPSIGRPGCGLDLYVLDDHLQLVAPGELGELYIAGDQMAHGYHRRTELTATRFVANPFATGRRLYRTGDVVAWNATGRLVYHGRADNQVQVAGFRIELGEVESALTTTAAQIGFPLNAVVCDVRTNRGSTPRLLAYVAGSATTDFGALRSAVLARVPAHLVPSVFVPVDTIPLTPAKKIDRAALPDPWQGVRTPTTIHADSAEAVLCGVIGELLDLSDVGADDDFFSLGGDSIIAIQVTSRAREFGVSIAPRHIFQARTPAAMARLIEESATAAPAPAADPLRAIGEVPLTPLMARVLRTGGPLNTFAQARILTVPTGTSRNDVAAVLEALTRTHPMLRARLDGYQLVVADADDHDHTDIVTEITTPEDINATTAADWLIGRLDTVAADLNPHRGQMISALIARDVPTPTADDPAAVTDALVLIIHHLVVDGVSWRILGEDIRAAFTAIRQATAVRLPDAGTSFREWTTGLASRAADDDIRNTEWAHPGHSATELRVGSAPFDPTRDVAGTAISLNVDLPGQSVVTTLPELYHTGATEILVATLALAVGQVFSEPSPTSDISSPQRVFIDLEGHGRDETLVPDVDLSRTIGWFTAFWPVPVELSPSPDPASPPALAIIDATIKAVKERIAAPPFSGLGYGLATELAPDARPQEPAPVLFNYLGRLTAGENRTGESAAYASLWPDRPLVIVNDPGLPLSHPLAVNALTVTADQQTVVRVEISAARDLITPTQLRDLAQSWSAILAALGDSEATADLGGMTPSDSLVAGLTQDEIDGFADEFA